MTQEIEFTIHHLRFEVQATTPLVLTEPAGPKLRAALYHATGLVCPLGADANAPPEHKASCPVCWLLSTEKPGAARGKDLPRPVTLEPPLNSHAARIAPGEGFSFGLTLFAQAVNLFPYLALAVPEMGRRGLGRRLSELGGERGQFKLRRAEAVNPLTGDRQCLLDMARSPLFHVPAVPVTARQIEGETNNRLAHGRSNGNRARVELRFLTPTRIVTGNRLAHRPDFPPLLARLYDRLTALSKHYALGMLAPDTDKDAMMSLADRVDLVGGAGGWREVRSYSRRLGRFTHLSGFVGRAVYEAPVEVWQQLLPFVLWGQSTHVGKGATKGNGWYAVRRELWPSSGT